MTEKITMTELGRREFPQSEECQQSSHLERHPGGRKSDHLSENKLSKSNSASVLGNLVLRNKLGDLYCTYMKPRRSKEKEVQENLRILNTQILKDISPPKPYLNGKANLLAKKLFEDIRGDNLLTEISKNRNYVTRINNLYEKEQLRYNKMMESIRERSFQSWKGHEQ